jgi:hypothetical protein
MLVTGTDVQTIRKSLKSKVDTLPDDLVIAVWTLLEPSADPQNGEGTKKKAAYQRLLKYKGTLHREIDCKKELAEWRDEKFNRTN